MKNVRVSLATFGLSALQFCTAYDIVREYAGNSFFDRWDYYGSWDNLTNGDVWWLDEQNATQQGLAYVNGAGNAIIRVDNYTTVPYNEKRNSVRITSTDSYNYGSLLIADFLHLPFGCSVWPAFWTKGPLWPDDGEIDIIEGINLMSENQMALHTLPGCYHTTPSTQIGQSEGLGPGNIGGSGLNSDGGNASDCSTPAGCVVSETKSGSFGQAFAQQGGGVFATQFDISGVYIWYWPRSQVPASIQNSDSDSSLALTDWGYPSASYPNTSCTFEDFFTPQQMVLDITLCGDWAGLGATYNASCGKSGPTGLCYNDNVVGNGSNYNNAYFEISHIRAYTTSALSGTQASDSSPQATGSNTSSGEVSLRVAQSEWVIISWITMFICSILGVLVAL